MRALSSSSVFILFLPSSRALPPVTAITICCSPRLSPATLAPGSRSLPPSLLLTFGHWDAPVSSLSSNPTGTGMGTSCPGGRDVSYGSPCTSPRWPPGSGVPRQPARGGWLGVLLDLRTFTHPCAVAASVTHLPLAARSRTYTCASHSASPCTLLPLLYCRCILFASWLSLSHSSLRPGAAPSYPPSCLMLACCFCSSLSYSPHRLRAVGFHLACTRCCSTRLCHAGSLASHPLP